MLVVIVSGGFGGVVGVMVVNGLFRFRGSIHLVFRVDWNRVSVTVDCGVYTAYRTRGMCNDVPEGMGTGVSIYE